MPLTVVSSQWRHHSKWYTFPKLREAFGLYFKDPSPTKSKFDQIANINQLPPAKIQFVKKRVWSRQIHPGSSELVFILMPQNSPADAWARHVTHVPAGENEFFVKVHQRACFVTTGATAPFPELIKTVVSVEFLDALRELDYTRLTIQCGKSLAYFHDIKPSDEVLNSKGLGIYAFDFNSKGLGAEMRETQGDTANNIKEGVVVAHAGAGTILDAMRLNVPLIVVPNPALLDNHQEELADELERQHYVTKGDVRDLVKALRTSEKRTTENLGEGKATWPPKPGPEDPQGTGAKGVIDEAVGYENEVRSSLD